MAIKCATISNLDLILFSLAREKWRRKINLVKSRPDSDFRFFSSNFQKLGRPTFLAARVIGDSIFVFFNIDESPPFPPLFEDLIRLKRSLLILKIVPSKCEVRLLRSDEFVRRNENFPGSFYSRCCRDSLLKFKIFVYFGFRVQRFPPLKKQLPSFRLLVEEACKVLGSLENRVFPAVPLLAATSKIIQTDFLGCYSEIYIFFL